MSPRTGRRAGDQGTREAILASARRSFAEHGFAGATIRAIAAAAGVDPALVHHYFGSKSELFAVAVQLPAPVAAAQAAVLAIEPERLGEAMVRTITALWDDPDGLAAWLGLIRSAVTDERAAAMLRELLSAAVVGPVAERLGGGDDAAYRITLAATQLVGLGLARHVLGMEPLASASTDDLVAAVAPALQRYLTGDIPLPGRHGRRG